MLSHLLIALLLMTQVSTPCVGLAIDNAFPNLGDAVTITICACSITEDPSTPVYFAIDGPDGRNVQHLDLTFNDLPIQIPWTIPVDSLSGLYTVTVTWDHQYVQTGFSVLGNPVPEFPHWVPVSVLASVLIAICLLTRRHHA
jgi:hypothetical protein